MLAGYSHAVACNTGLKNTDGYSDLSQILSCLNKKIGKLEQKLKSLEKGAASGNLNTITIPSYPKIPRNMAQKVVSIGGFDFYFKGCYRRHGQRVKCKFRVINANKKTVNLEVNTSTGPGNGFVGYDGDGNRYFARKVALGDMTASNGSYTNFIFPPKIQANLEYEFHEIPVSVTGFVKIHFYANGNGSGKADLGTVPILRGR